MDHVLLAILIILLAAALPFWTPAKRSLTCAGARQKPMLTLPTC